MCATQPVLPLPDSPGTGVGGRFFLPDIVDAARQGASADDVKSEEDPVALFEPGRGRRRHGISFAIAERLTKWVPMGSLDSWHILQFMDKDGQKH